MTSRHLRTLAAVFEVPVRANILWSDIEALCMYLGGTVRSAAGSRVKLKLNGVAAVFHRPHPRKEAKRSVIREVNLFLDSAGVRP